MAYMLEFYAATEPILSSFSATITKIEVQPDGYKITYDIGVYQFITASEGIIVSEGQSISQGERISLNDGTINYEKKIHRNSWENLFKSVRGTPLKTAGRIIDYKKIWIKYIDPTFETDKLNCFINQETPSPYDIIYIAKAKENDNLTYLKEHLSEYEFTHPIGQDNPIILKERVVYNDEIPIWLKREIITPAETYLNNNFILAFQMIGS